MKIFTIIKFIKPIIPRKLKNIIKIFVRKINQRNNLKKFELEACILSPGGSGTTYLMEFIKHFKKINCYHDSDFLKHQYKPPLKLLNIGVKVIFLKAKPEDIYNSMKRRGWIEEQSIKINSLGGVLCSGKLQKFFFIKNVEKLINSFQILEPKYPNLLIIDYDNIPQSIEVIKNFLDIDDKSFVENFPKQKQRRTLNAE